MGKTRHYKNIVRGEDPGQRARDEARLYEITGRRVAPGGPAKKRHKRRQVDRGWKGIQQRSLFKLGFGTYREYLASALWKGIKERVLASHPACRSCLKRNAVTAHHCRYTLDVMSGDDLGGLIPVCMGCHRAGHFTKDGSFRGPGAAAGEIKRRGKSAIWFGLGFHETHFDPTSDLDWIERHFVRATANNTY